MCDLGSFWKSLGCASGLGEPLGCLGSSLNPFPALWDSMVPGAGLLGFEPVFLHILIQPEFTKPGFEPGG